MRQANWCHDTRANVCDRCVYITNTKGAFTPTIRRGPATKLVAKKPVTSSHKWLLRSQATVLDQSCDCSCNAAEPISGTGTGDLQTLTLVLRDDVSASRYERHQSQEVSVWRWESRTCRFVHQSPPVAIHQVASPSSWCEWAIRILLVRTQETISHKDYCTKKTLVHIMTKTCGQLTDLGACTRNTHCSVPNKEPAETCKHRTIKQGLQKLPTSTLFRTAERGGNKTLLIITLPPYRFQVFLKHHAISLAPQCSVRTASREINAKKNQPLFTVCHGMLEHKVNRRERKFMSYH